MAQARSFVRDPVGGEVSRDLPGGEHPSGTRIGQTLLQVTHQLGIRQYLDRLAQPVQLARGHNVSHVVAVRDDRDRLATFGPAHDFCPRRLILGADRKPSLTHRSIVDGPTRSDWPQTEEVAGSGRGYDAGKGPL